MAAEDHDGSLLHERFIVTMGLYCSYYRGGVAYEPFTPLSIIHMPPASIYCDYGIARVCLIYSQLLHCGGSTSASIVAQ